MNKTFTTIILLSAVSFLLPKQEVFAMIAPEEVVSLTNQERIQAGLPTLIHSPVLDQAAEAKADDMAAEQYFSHTSPKGVTPWEWFRQSRYEYRYAGENLAIHFRDAAAEEQAWMESKKHCENILSPKYREIGVAVREMPWEGKQTVVAVQLFGTQMSDEQKVSASDKPTSLCPKPHPSVFGTSVSTSGSNGSVSSAVMNALADTARQWKIDTPRLLTILFFSVAQVAGFIVVLTLATQKRWLRRW